MEKKRIVWITPDCFWDTDGAIVPKLMELYNIRWYVVRPNESKKVIQKNTSINKVITFNNRYYNPNIIKEYNALLSDIVDFHPNLVYTGFEGFPYFMPLFFKSLKGIKTILAGHETNPWRRGSRRWPVRIYLRYLIQRMNHVQVFSKFAEREFGQLYPGKNCTYVPMALKDYGEPTEKFNSNGKKLFLFFGTDRPDKRLDVLLKAFLSLDEDCKKNARLLVYGATSHDNQIKYEELCKGNENIELNFGFVDDNKIPNLFTSVDYLVLPYQQVSQSGPNMIAYRYGLPIIASDIPGFSERITDGINGYLFEVNNYYSLKSVLEYAIKAPMSEYLTLKENIKKFAEDNYSFNSIIERYSKMIDQII